MDLSPLLAPRSIAVVGATDRPESYAANVLSNLERAGFDGPVWGVNPNREEALGRRCFPTIADLPEPADAVVVAIPAPGVAAAVRDAGERGCGGAVVLSAGFGEVGSGRALEVELREAARAHDLALCGPNGNGIVSVRERAVIWGDRAPALDPGGVAMVTQSGNVGVNALGSQRGIRWHTVVSTGNETVCSAADWLEALAQRDGVRSIAVFCEAEGDGARLAAALAACAEHEVGVAVLKVGASEAGARAAASHTGALAGDQRVFRALVEEAGAAWAEDLHDLLELAKALGEPRARPRGDGGLAVLTCSGGDSGVAADIATGLGLELPELAPATRRTLTGLLPPAATIANPLDYTAMIWGDAPLLGEIVATVGADPAIDQLLLCYDQPADADESWAAVRTGLADGARAAAGPGGAATIVGSTLPDLLEPASGSEFADAGIPAVAGLRTALVCARALRASGVGAKRLREISAVARDRVSEGKWMDEAAAKDLLRERGIAVVDGTTVGDGGECVAAAEKLGYPVALKLVSPSLRHKSDSGALALALRSAAEVNSAAARLAALPEAAGARFLVERMAEPGVELLVAARSDGVVPCLLLAIGGVDAELLGDVAIVPLPVSTARVREALLGLRGAALLTGARGRAAVDLDAIAALAVATAETMRTERLTVLELNPVICTPHGAVAVDALARRASPPAN